MRTLWVIAVVSLLLNIVLGGVLYRAQRLLPLPDTRNGCSVIKYSISRVHYNAQDRPVDVTFFIGQNLWETNGKVRPAFYTFTFPYAAYRQDPTLPFSTFVVRGSEVLCSKDLAALPQPGVI